MANAIPVTSDQWNKIHDQGRARAGQEYQFGEDIYRWEFDQSAGEFGLKFLRAATGSDADPMHTQTYTDASGKGDLPPVSDYDDRYAPMPANVDPKTGRIRDSFSNANLDSSGQTGKTPSVNMSSGVNGNRQSGFSAFTGSDNMAPTNNPWGDWSPVFGEYSPQDQYRSMMATSMPNYYAPRYGQMANRQFAPTFGRYLLGGYGGDTTGLGTGSDFSQWYQGQGMTPGVTSNLDPSNISAGYNQALQFGAMTPGSTGWGNLASNAPGMAYAMQDPDAVQAMALSRYYGGGAPQGYAARAVQSSLGNLYDRYMTRGAQTGVTGPSGFLNYLGGLNQGRFGAFNA